MTQKKTYKTFKEFAKEYLKEYDDAYFVGTGGFSIGSMDAMKPDADLGDIGPTNQGLGDMRGTVAQYPQSKLPQNIKKDRFQRLEDEQVDVSQVHTHISGLHYNDKETAEHGIKRIEDSGHSHEHKIYAAETTAEKAKIASERAKDEEVKVKLKDAHFVYKNYADSKRKKK